MAASDNGYLDLTLRLEGQAEALDVRTPPHCDVPTFVARVAQELKLQAGAGWRLLNVTRGYEYSTDDTVAQGGTTSGDTVELAPVRPAAPTALTQANGTDRRRLRSLLRASEWCFLAGLAALLTAVPALGWKTPYFWICMIPSTASLAAVIGTALPRLAWPAAFGRWFDPAQAARDWLVIGAVTGLTYVLAFEASRVSPAFAIPAEEYERWMRFRLPLLLIASACAVGFAALCPWTRPGGFLPTDYTRAGALLVVYATLTAISYLFVQSCLTLLLMHRLGHVIPLLGLVLVALGGGGLAFLRLTFTRDHAAARLPLVETITIIGGKGVGKTMLLTMAYHELATRLWGRIIVRGTQASEQYCEGIFRTMDSTRQWPNESLHLNLLPFKLTVGLADVARFEWNDYPGGVVSDPGNPMMREPRAQFMQRALCSTAILVVVDMLALCNAGSRMLATYAALLRDMFTAYRDTRGARGTFPPVCVALTKCDTLQESARSALFDRDVRPLIALVEALAREAGDHEPRVAHFFTSALEGVTHHGGLMQLPPAPFPLKSRGCAEVLLWIVAQALRRDYDLADGVEDFFGISQLGTAILELEAAARR